MVKNKVNITFMYRRYYNNRKKFKMPKANLMTLN